MLPYWQLKMYFKRYTRVILNDNVYLFSNLI